MNLNKDSMEISLNPATGSAFFVLRKNHGLSCGFRLWMETRQDGSNHADLCFRFRVEALPDFSTPHTVFKDFLTAMFPETKWSKVTSKYGSILGTVSTGVPLWDFGGLEKALTSNEVPQKMFDFLVDNLRPMEFEFEREDFVAFVWSLINHELSGLKTATETSDPSTVALKSEGVVAYFKDGFCVTPVSYTSPAIEGSGLPPVAYEPSQAVTNPPEVGQILPGGGEVGGPGVTSSTEEPDGMPNVGEGATSSSIHGVLKSSLGGDPEIPSL